MNTQNFISGSRQKDMCNTKTCFFFLNSQTLIIEPIRPEEKEKATRPTENKTKPGKKDPQTPPTQQEHKPKQEA